MSWFKASICKDKKQVCQSKITKLAYRIICNKLWMYSSSDCQDDNCVCISGSVFPNLVIWTTTVKRWNIQYVNMISCVIFNTTTNYFSKQLKDLNLILRIYIYIL